ncbi:MAG: glycosyltransferase, partial [Verrucomicrobia bacterium]|nr:glycosyltransferase [Verrucomicrobiota bacterium]
MAPIILHYLHRDNFGGGPKNVVQVIDALAGLGEQQVVTAGAGRLTEQLKSRPEVKLHKISDLSPALFPVTAWRLNSLMSKVRPQMVITHGQWGGMFMGMALRMAAPVQGVFVTQWCSLYESRDAWRSARNWLAEWFAFSRHQHIVCASDGNVRQFLYSGLLDDRSRVAIIPNPLEPPTLAEAGVIARLTPPARVEGLKTFVFLGRLERQKRPDWLLMAWKRALDGGMKNARLLILGEGAWRARCQKIIRDQLLSDSVTMLGHRTDAAWYLQSSDGLLLTSLY